jgi:hypothetical protein
MPFLAGLVFQTFQNFESIRLCGSKVLSSEKPNTVGPLPLISGFSIPARRKAVKAKDMPG